MRTLPSGQTQLFVGLHLVHEVTSPQAFDMLRQHGWSVAFPERTFATVDHIVPTLSLRRPFLDLMAEEMTTALERNCREFGIRLAGPGEAGGEPSEDQGIVHVIGPELGLTQPGMTIACGDSHTSTHGALGAIAFGIGTSQVRDVLASQCLALDPLKVRRIDVNGTLRPGVYAKDVILTIIRRLGVQGGVGYAYEYGGTAIDRMSMDERMTICNMSIEGGARVGYVNPDETTFAFLQGRRFAPQGAAFDRAVAWWRSIASDAGAPYDDRVVIDAASIEPTVTWGINPGQSVGIGEAIPAAAQDGADEALAFMGFTAGIAHGGDADRRRVHRIVHQRPALRSGGGGARRARAPRGEARDGARRAGIAARQPRGRSPRDRRRVQARRLRMARRRLLDVPRHEHRSPRGASDLRVVVESQLQGTPGQPDGPDAAHEPGDGRGRGDCRTRSSTCGR